MTLASYITSLRVILILPIMYFSYFDLLLSDLFALTLFLIAGLTDYLDGYVARKSNTESSLGAALDLLADKLLVCLILVWLAYLDKSLMLVSLVLIILMRELVISSLRQYIVERSESNKLSVSYAGKSKTTAQIVAISFLLIAPHFGVYFYYLAMSVLVIATYLSLSSLYGYIKLWKKILD
jgi:CDP-diacylglycerol--glycerol-3-phosphate 3-phosphatidyltransferase